jgi:hypothetical protein
MKSSVNLIRFAGVDSYENVEESLEQKNQERKNRSQSDSDDRAERYKFLKNKADEMQISIADYIEFFGSFEDKKNFRNLAQQQSNIDNQEESSNAIKDYEKVLEAFEFIKEKSKELNVPISSVWEDMQLPSEIRFKVHTLVVNYERLQKIEESRKVQNNGQSNDSFEERLRRSTENARFYTEQWNQVIEDAEKQNIDPIVYISAQYPDDLAEQIIAWYKIKTGEINARNIEEYFAQSIEQLSDQEVESFEQNYDDNAFQNFVDKAREIVENIDWEKAGAYLDEGKNRIIYQLLKPGSNIKKTSDAIKVVMSMLSLKNVEEFNNQYYKDQENRERAINELDSYKISKKMNLKLKKLAQLNQEIELLESAGLIKAASVLHKKFIKEAQAAPQPGGQSKQTNPGIEVIKPGQTPPPVQTPPPAQQTLPPLPPGYNIQDNYYQDPKTGGNVYIDPRTGQPFEGGLTKGYGTPGTYTNPGGEYYTVPPAPGTPPIPAPAPGNTPPTIDLGIPSFKDRYDFYYGKVDQGFNIQDPQQQQEYFKRLKEQILNQLLFGLIDQKTYNDLMRLFAR